MSKHLHMQKGEKCPKCKTAHMQRRGRIEVGIVFVCPKCKARLVSQYAQPDALKGGKR